MFINAEMLDRDDNLLNMLNGTYNTETMSFQEHSADDLLSKRANVIYNPDASAEVFERFIRQIMLDDRCYRICGRIQCIGNNRLGLRANWFLCP